MYLIRRKELSDFNIAFDPPAPKESWAHGLLERAVQEVKEVASKIRLSNTDLTPETVLALATHALNSTEYVQGYTPFQRVYGAQPTLTDEDIASFSLSPDDAAGLNYGALLKKRQEAENVARYVKAMRTINKIKNSNVRQPLQTFHPMDLVTIWRKYTSPVGLRGGLKKTARPQWLGPGGVVFRRPSMDNSLKIRRHIVWVAAGGTMHRCSVHSVRKVTTQERLDFELHSGEDPRHWKSLANAIPQRSFVDCVPEEPGEDEEDLPQFRGDPNATALPSPRPMMRHFYKHPVRKVAFAEPPAAEAQPVNSYDPSFAATPGDDDDDDDDDDDERPGNTGLGSGIPTLEERSGSSKSRLLPSESAAASSAPESKKVRVDVVIAYLEVIDERWLKIRASIDSMYKWGQLKKNEYRHAGTDLSMKTDPG